jgi:3-hydroxyacyl-CoA dehydrogenase
MANSDVVIEAVAERLEVKRSVFESAAKQLGEKAILATNTSSLSVSRIAEGIPHPERVAGLHFFNPVDRMPLVEVIRGEQTSEETVEKLAAFTRRMGKIPVVVNDRPGFLVNRLLLPYLNGAAILLEEGADVQTIDKALIAFGMPMGAFILLDQVGADIAAHAAKSMFEGFGDRMRPSPIIEAMVDAGRLGKKTGKGFYTWKGGKRQAADPGAGKVIAPHVREKRKVTEEEIIDRLIIPMVNEATWCLEENVVDSPQAVDAATIFGAGFPAFTGGLLRYADSIGARQVVETLTELTERLGPGYAPSETLVRMAEKEEVFYS